MKNMKKISLTFIFIFSCWAMIFAQNKENKPGESGFDLNLESFRGCKDCRPSEGTCEGVIEQLRVSQNNDSMAVAIFKKEYEIVNVRYQERERFLKKNHAEIIQYFARNENKKYYCRSKILKRYDPVLLVD